MNDDHDLAASIVMTHATFMQGGVAIDVAACDAEQLPFITIGCGCRVAADGRRIAVFVNRAQSTGLLDAVAETGHVAVVFGQPSTHLSFQIKGCDANVLPFAASDLPLVMQYRDDFAADMHKIGLPRSLVFTYLDIHAETLAVVAFTPTMVYAQTPGPGAGERIAAP